MRRQFASLNGDKNNTFLLHLPPNFVGYGFVSTLIYVAAL
jgi:hypothetical protein